MIRPFKSNTRNRSSLGIDIGPASIKAAVIRDEEMSLLVTHVARVPTPIDAVDRAVIDIPSVSDVIRQMIRRFGGAFREASICVPSESTQVWWLELPSMDEATLRAATRFEARKYLNYPVEQAFLQIIPFPGKASEDSQTLPAMLVAVPADVVSSRAEAVEAAGLIVDCVEIEALALTRALQTPDSRRQVDWGGGSHAYLQLGEDQSSMSVMKGGALQFVRGVTWGSNRITDAIADELGLARNSALAIKEHASANIIETASLVHDAFGSGQQEIEAVAEEIGRLAREMRRTMSYYKSLFPEGSYEGTLERIVLCGGTAKLRGLAHYLSNQLEVECVIGDPFATQIVQLEPSARKAVAGYEPSYAGAVGLAIGGLRHRSETGQATEDIEYLWRRQPEAEGVGV